jgi:hypothetical protein
VDQATRELLVARIVSGVVRCPVAGTVVLAKWPTREQRYRGQELYQQTYHECEMAGLYTDDELLAFLNKAGFWDSERQETLEAVEKDVENLKVSLYHAGFRSGEVKMARKLLSVAKGKMFELLGQRHAYDYLTCAGTAVVARARFLISSSLFHLDGRRVTNRLLVDQANDYYVKNRLVEATFRELARTEPWRNIWSGKRAEGGIFGVASVDMTDEQRSLQIWSSLYENIAECPDGPSDSVLDDDDALDGWLILQQRKRKKGQLEKRADELLGNEKIRGSQEVFVPADSLADARQIEELNDQHSATIKKQRMAALNKKGKMTEAQMPDTKRMLQMEATKLSAAAARGAR